MFRALRMLGASIVLWMAAATAAAQVLVVLSDEAASYEEVATALRAQLAPLRAGQLRIDTVTAQTIAARGVDADSRYELVVTVGLAAAQAVTARETATTRAPPVLCLLIPRQGYEALTRERGTGRDLRISAVYLDQPVSRQLDLLRITLPARSRVGVVLGPSSASLRDELRERGRDRGLAMDIIDVAQSSAVYGALQQVLSRSDLLLAVPDPVTFNASVFHGLLLTTYRAGVPVIGFSEGLVKAGALLGVFSTAAQIGRQGGEIAARAVEAQGALPLPAHPRYFSVKANYSVARSLGIALEPEAVIAAALAEREARRTRDSGEPSPSGGPR